MEDALLQSVALRNAMAQAEKAHQYEYMMMYSYLAIGIKRFNCFTRRHKHTMATIATNKNSLLAILCVCVCDSIEGAPLHKLVILWLTPSIVSDRPRDPPVQTGATWPTNWLAAISSIARGLAMVYGGLWRWI